MVEDPESRNGTVLNRTENRVKGRLLRDGDFVYAGSDIFAFLDQGRRT